MTLKNLITLLLINNLLIVNELHPDWMMYESLRMITRLVLAFSNIEDIN